MKLFLVRHGESEHNRKIRDNATAVKQGLTPESFPDARDLPLTPEGIEQITKTLEKLPAVIDGFYSSDHIRTRQSADGIQEKYPDHPYLVDARINASFGGSLDHHPISTMQELTGIDFKKAIDDDTFDFTPWDGENAEMVHARVRSFLEDLFSKNYQTVVVVTSLEVIKSVYKILFGDKALDIVRSIRAKNGTVHEFHIESRDIEIPH